MNDCVLTLCYLITGDAFLYFQNTSLFFLFSSHKYFVYKKIFFSVSIFSLSLFFFFFTFFLRVRTIETTNNRKKNPLLWLVEIKKNNRMVTLLVEKSCLFSTLCAWNVEQGELLSLLNFVSAKKSHELCSLVDDQNYRSGIRPLWDADFRKSIFCQRLDSISTMSQYC